MAFPLGEILATTIEHRNKKFVDNITNQNALLSRLQEKGNIKTVDGGRTILEELEYAENGTVRGYSGYEELDITPAVVFDAAEFDWRQVAGSVSISGLEALQNSGRERMIPLLESRLKNLETSMRNHMAVEIYNDGTDPKEINGLRFLVPDSPTSSSVVGGINQQSQTWWQSQVVNGVTIGTTNNILSKMNQLWLECMHNNEKPDIIPMDANYYTAYESQLQQFQRFASSDRAAAGFNFLKYKSADVFYDSNCPSNHAYFLNTNFIYLRPHKDRMYVPLTKRESLNQDATVMPVVWAGNFTVSNRRNQGVLIA